MKLGCALSILALSASPLAGAGAQEPRSAREAFLAAAEAGDLKAMKPLIASPVRSMLGGEFSPDQFLGMIEGCSHSFTGKALVSWRCGSNVVTVALTDGPERVSLSGLSSIARSSAPPGERK